MEYSKKVENDFKRHDDQVNSLNERNARLLENQQNTIIEDANNDKKRAAVNNMRLTYEKQLKHQMDEESRKERDKKLELQETKKILQLQMDNKYLSKVATQENDKQFRSYLDQTISILGNRETEEKDK